MFYLSPKVFFKKFTIFLIFLNSLCFTCPKEMAAGFCSVQWQRTLKCFVQMCLFISLPFPQCELSALITIVQFSIRAYKDLRLILQYIDMSSFSSKDQERKQRQAVKEGHDQEESTQYYESALHEFYQVGCQQLQLSLSVHPAPQYFKEEQMFGEESFNRTALLPSHISSYTPAG